MLNDEMPGGGFSHGLPNAAQSPAPNLKALQMPNEAMPYRLIYPEMYYRLQPYIMMVCDEWDMYPAMPTQEMVESITDSIYDDICRMYPDIAKYVGELKMEDSNASNVNQDDFRRRFRRRGVFRDLIDILLINEFLRRRRRRFFFFG